jgi:hypothetical protein
MLREDAVRYIWWETADEAMLRPARVIAQVMNLGDLDHAQALLGAVGEDAFRDVLASAEPGWFNARSWHYWHFRLGLCPPGGEVPPMPERRF